MKKTLKELLWFAVPTVLIVAMYATIYTLADLQINIPKWIGMNQYLLLFSKSPEFAEIVFNTVLYNVVPALVTTVVLFAVQLIAKMKRPLYYGIMATSAALANLCFKVFYLNPKFLGFPQTTYPADTIVTKPQEITAFDMLKAITLYDVLQSMLIGIIICFVFWMVEQLIKVLRPRVSE